MNKEIEKEFEDKFGDFYLDVSEGVHTMFDPVDSQIIDWIDTHFIAKKDLKEAIDVKLENCDKAIEDGCGRELGSASGSVQLFGCKAALQDLKDKLL